MRQGFAYLNIVMDWHSRYILSYTISNSLSNDFCVEALDKALETSKPEFFNTDQGSQYTSKNFIDILKQAGIKISMNSKGRALDNIFVERFWRSIKQEKIYINDYRTMKELKAGVEEYIRFYNYGRPYPCFKL